MSEVRFSTALMELSQADHREDKQEAHIPMIQEVLMPAHDCWYPPAIEVADVLRVDFSHKTVGPDGHYLIQIQDEHGEWRGCRHFRRLELSGRLEMDVSGSGEWRSVNNLAAMNIEVLGFVIQVYKPAAANTAMRVRA